MTEMIVSMRGRVDAQQLAEQLGKAETGRHAAANPVTADALVSALKLS